MSRKLIVLITIIVVSVSLVRAGVNEAQKNRSEPVLSVTGLVQKPLNLSLDDLSRFQSGTVRLNEILRGNRFNGVFRYRGVPLRTLLEFASIRKQVDEYSKPIDLAVIVRSGNGNRAVLSWGEIFYSNPHDVLIAFSAEPVMPMKECRSCHKTGSFEKWEKPLHRKAALPKLVLADDFFTDRCLEGVVNIEVAALKKEGLRSRPETIYSPAITITKNGSVLRQIKELPRGSRVEIQAKQVGDGKGFHGMRSFSGAPLSEVFSRAGIAPSLESALMITAPDGYRSLVSWGEITLAMDGSSVILADKENAKPLGDGKFYCVMGHDLSADRWVKAVKEIEIINVKADPKLYIIGVGCGDTDLITLEAVSVMGEASSFVCTKDIEKRFSRYMGGKSVLYDPLLNMVHYYRKMNPGVSLEESKRIVTKLREKNIQSIKDELKRGRSVAFLDYGDPTLYGSWTYWLLEHFERHQYVVVPGISAFNAANASIAKNLAVNGSVVITVPDGIRSNQAMVKAVADNGDTLAIFVGLKDLESLVPLLDKYFGGDTPVYIVYRAGYSESEEILKSTVKNVVKDAAKSRERFLGVIYIGEPLGENYRPKSRSKENDNPL